MKVKKEDSRFANEVQFELKYCERCGGLWLRPTGGGQVYCVACARQMAQLPPASKEPERARMSQGPQWGRDDDNYGPHEGEDESDVNVTGDVA